MIAQLQGQVVGVDASTVVVSAGGVGFAVLCPPQTASGLAVGATVTLFTSLIVREDAMALYGFLTQAERLCFDTVRGATGIGPKIGLAVVAALGPVGLADAVRREDFAALVRVPGIGRKGAQRLVIELKDKVPVLLAAAGADETSASAANGWRDQVVSGLEGLGWPVKQAESAADGVASMVEDDPAVSVSTLMRAALQGLARA
ncbi:MAG: Holliday junction branch migration protein RuvA [Propionibacteriaceae bacterium]|nr:Holliday junction branch migration protein RuvA [Propionibacteriaceae bacterium]